MHVDEVTLEDAARFGLLESPDFGPVREHVTTCEYCRERLAELDEFSRFLAEAPEEETSGECVSKCETSAGTVFLVVTGSDTSSWEARAIGGGHYLMRSFAKGPDANAWLDDWFRATFR